MVYYKKAQSKCSQKITAVDYSFFLRLSSFEIVSLFMLHAS